MLKISFNEEKNTATLLEPFQLQLHKNLLPQTVLSIAKSPKM